MKPLDEWPRMKLVLEGALARQGADRQAYLADACGSDGEFRGAVDRLLAAGDRVGHEDFLETPCVLVLDELDGDADLSGRTFNAYQLVSRLGAGGMGVVYRAHDTRLNRDVAVKLLPTAFATDASRLSRFKREAHLLASLNHPLIGSIFGFEESGSTHALILELVEGPTLAERIAHGPLPLDEALSIARQLAEAIEAAHEHRIIHRDLKPANIKLRPDGTVKVLDFGLAEAFEADGAESGAEPGRIAGTAAYMSPEQARGKPVDRRCDIWAFGCVFYEMLTGRRLFDGRNTTEILASVTERQSNLDALPNSTPASVRRLLRRCLEKDRRKRLPDIGVARIEIDDAITATPGVDSSSARRSPPTAAAMVGAALIVGAVAGWLYSRRAPAAPPAPVRASISIEAGLDFGVQQPSLAISPDGHRIVYRPLGGGPLRSRLLTEAVSSEIAGTEGAVNPFFSPDGKWLAFFVGPQLKKVAFDGGAIVALATLPRNVGAQGYRGGTWSDDGVIAFASSTASGLYSIPDRGGDPKPLTAVTRGNEAAHRWPHFLPGGRAILFTVKSTNLQSFDDAPIVVRSLDSGTERPVAQGGSAQYLPTGHLVYARAGALYAVRFDTARLEATGTPTRILEGVVTHPESGAAQVAVSRTGTLVYASGGSTTAERPLLWVDRRGTARAVNDRQAPFWWPRLSPDGRRIAVVIDAPFSKLWVLDVERGVFTRASQLPGDQDRAVWMPDGAHLTFGADTTGSGALQLYSEPFDGSGPATQLLDRAESPSPLSWSPDGRHLLYRRISATTGQDVWVYSADDRSSRPLLQTAANEWSAAFSTDGRWIAYVSDESGRAEVYVRPFPGPGARHQVSVDGGTAPVWSRDGRELFFGKGETLYATSVSLLGAFANGPPQRLFSGPYGFDDVTVSYDVTPDSRHFLVPRSRVDSAPRQIELVLNWFDDITRLAQR